MKYNWTIHKVIAGFMKNISSVLGVQCTGKEPLGPSCLMSNILFKSCQFISKDYLCRLASKV